MTMCEQDPNIYRWGLHHLFDGLSVSDYPETCVQNDVRAPESECLGGDHAAVENDEVLAHALQEELSQVAAAEASGAARADVEHSKASVLAQDWFSVPVRHVYLAGNEDGREALSDFELFSTCSSPEEKLYEGEAIPLELTDEFASLDGEVGKRLNHVVPVPHVPKINGEIPSVDEATTDHQRLLDRLRLYDLVELKVQGDGNCQFRALSDQFYRAPEHHKFVRQQIVNQLKSHPEMYEGYVPMAYGEYLKTMAKSGEWGDHVTLQAAADTYGVKIFVLTSFKDTCYIEILPNVQKSKRVIFLSFWAEVHYNSIYPEGDFPDLEIKKKKKWWHFGH